MSHFPNVARSIDLSVTGEGGVAGANKDNGHNVQCYKVAEMMYAGDEPKGRAPGKNPAYGSVGVDGHWPGTPR